MAKIINQEVNYNTYQEARDVLNKAERKRNRSLIGLGVAIVATCLTLVGLFSPGHETMLAFAFMLAFPAYILGGGFGRALKTAGKLAKFGWFIVPFPYDLVTGVVTLMFSVISFCFVPAVFVLGSFLDHNREYNEARKHLSYYSAA